MCLYLIVLSDCFISFFQFFVGKSIFPAIYISADCVAHWPYEWSECSAPCGGGVQSQSELVLRYEHSGGKACAPMQTRQRACNVQPCEGEEAPVAGTWPQKH
jgi:hypothetical protein